MSVTRVDLEREQLAHATTREALERSQGEVRNLVAILRDRPTVEELDSANARADRLATQLAKAPKQADISDAEQRAARAIRRAETAEAKPPKEKRVTVYTRHPDDAAEIARLTAIIDRLEREARAK